MSKFSGSDKKLSSDFGEMVREKRREKGISQEALSNMVGITDGYLRDLENGMCLSAWPIWMRLCNVLDIDVVDIRRIMFT